jgi:hypothetical protein
MCLAPVIRRSALQSGGFHSVARSGQKSIAHGLPWVSRPRGMSPHKAHECAFHEKHPVLRVGDAEGAGRYGENRLQAFEPDRVHIASPFRANRLFRLTQGKPWAKLSCPFGVGPSGRMTIANHIRAAEREEGGA